MTYAAMACLACACTKKKSAKDEVAPPAEKPTADDREPVAAPPPKANAAQIPGAAMTLGSDRWRVRGPLRSARFDGDGRVVGLIGGEVTAIDAATGAVTTLAVVPGGEALAVLPGGGFVVGGRGLHFLDASGKQVREAPIAAGAITSIAVTADGKQLALSGHHGAIVVVDAATGAEVERVPAGAEGYEGVALAGDARVVALRGEAVVVVERAGAKELSKTAAPQGTWAITGTHLATVAGGNPIDGYDVDVWNAETGALVVGIHRERAVRALAWLPDGATLLIGDEAGAIERFAIADGAATSAGPPVTIHGSAITALAVAPGGGRYAAITDAGAVRVVEMTAAAPPDAGQGHLGAVERLAFAGDFLISGGADATVWTWELTGSRRVAKIELDGELMAMTTMPDDEGLYAQVDAYARPAGQGYTSLARHTLEGYTMSGARKFSQELDHGADGIKYCGFRNAIQEVTGSHWKEIDPTSFDVTERGRSTGGHGRIGPNGRFAAFEGHGALIVLDDDGTHRLGTAKCSLVYGVAFDQAGEVVAMTDGTGAMRLWRTDGELVGGVSAPGASIAEDGVVLPDHATALFTLPDGLLVWDQAQGTAGKISLSDPSALAITPEGDRLAVGFKDGRIGIFDLATLRATMTPLETSPAPELTDDDCHMLRPEAFPDAPVERRFGEP